MSDELSERTNGCVITTYIPVFKDKLAKLERRGLGHSEEALRLRVTIARVEERSSPSVAGDESRLLVIAAE